MTRGARLSTTPSIGNELDESSITTPNAVTGASRRLRMYSSEKTASARASAAKRRRTSKDTQPKKRVVRKIAKTNRSAALIPKMTPKVAVPISPFLLDQEESEVQKIRGEAILNRLQIGSAVQKSLPLAHGAGNIREKSSVTPVMLQFEMAPLVYRQLITKCKAVPKTASDFKVFRERARLAAIKAGSVPPTGPEIAEEWKKMKKELLKAKTAAVDEDEDTAEDAGVRCPPTTSPTTTTEASPVVLKAAGSAEKSSKAAKRDDGSASEAAKEDDVSGEAVKPHNSATKQSQKGGGALAEAVAVTMEGGDDFIETRTLDQNGGAMLGEFLGPSSVSRQTVVLTVAGKRPVQTRVADSPAPVVSYSSLTRTMTLRFSYVVCDL